VIPYHARVVGLLMTPVHATHEAVVAKPAVVAVVALPEILMPQVQEALDPVREGE
jgi:hypothetical protein